MTNNLMTLLRVEQKKHFCFDSLNKEKDQRKRNRKILLLVVIGFVVVMMAAYCFGIAYGFGYMKMSYVIPGYALTISAIVTLFFTFLKTNGVLFASKDYDMLMALPIRTETVITAKFLTMYLNNLAFTALVMLPMMVGYMLFQPLSFLGIFLWVGGILVAPLLPMTIAAIVGAVITALSAGFRHTAAVQLSLTILLLLTIMGASFWIQKNAGTDEEALLAILADLGIVLSQTLHKVYPLSGWFDNAINNRKILEWLLFVGISFLIYGIFVPLCGKNYRKINTALHSHHASTSYQMGTLKRSSIQMAIVKKEAKRFFTSALYMTNIGMGLILALLAEVASLFLEIDSILNGIDIPNIVNLLPFAIAMLVNMCNTTSVSLSLEGKNRWIVQSLPISKKVLLQGKMLFNIVLVLPISLICNVLFVYKFQVQVGLAILYLVFSVVSVCFSTVLGAWINLKLPNYQWENEVEVIKQGASSMLGIFGSLVFYLVLAVLALGLSGMLAGEWILLGACVLLGLLGGVLYQKCA